ncbi:pirin family protein [Hymenobacter sp. HMF4947]|uniref:Pirin family protein n=1 Tax=Hymenobacter ginkgonis TaxID=2682976 RepID=A0A7K1TBJ0_9BACT|nr:pirin family protein [Hymenobacter ginkgonis]MVN75672.1 pirin family protein [Hymenobacter ginkgonis]
MTFPIFHPAATRLHADLGWLDAYRSFNTGGSYDPNRQAFGALRILNDDTVAGGRGFGRHPHQNMEIITLPLAGALEHEDSLGHRAVIRAGEVQVMSAGTGISHSEKNHSPHDPVHFLQIWLTTNQPDATPRYEQQAIASLPNHLVQIASPHEGEPGVHLRQQAWLHLATLIAGTALTYQPKAAGNGVYALVLQGEVLLDGQRLGVYDGLGSWEPDALHLEASSPATVLLLDVPRRA